MSIVPEYAPKYRPLNRSGGLSLCYSRCDAGPHDRAYDEQHGFFSVAFVDRGVFSYRSALGDAVLGPGWLMLGNDGHGYSCSHEHGDGSGDDCIVLRFSPQSYDAVQSALGQLSGPFDRASLPPLPRVAALMRSCIAAGDEGFALEETALAVVAAIQTASAGVRPAVVPHRRDLALAAARFIESHAAQPLSLDTLAGDVGLSRFHFLRTFRHAIGVTPHQYLLRMRLIRAVALLRDTRLPVTEVGYEAGWADLSNFTRTFRREIGCSPRDFRCGGILPAARRAGRPVPHSPLIQLAAAI